MIEGLQRALDAKMKFVDLTKEGLPWTDLTAADIVSRFEELYNWLGVTRHEGYVRSSLQPKAPVTATEVTQSEFVRVVLPDGKSKFIKVEDHEDQP